MTGPQIICSMVKAGSFSSKIRNKTKMLTLTAFIQHSIGSHRQSNQVIKEIKRNKKHSTQKEVKLSLFEDDTIFYKYIMLKLSPKYYQNLKTNSVYFQNTKAIHKKSVAYLYTKNKLLEREIKKTVLFIVDKKYLGINLTSQ